MAKKLLETSIGNGSETAFVFKGKRIMDLRQLPVILSDECNPYVTHDDGGVIVYFSQEEYDKLKKEYNVQE